MPRGDGTGPIGMGAITGKGFGNCLAYGLPIIAGNVTRFGKGRGFCFWGSVIAGVATAARYIAEKNKKNTYRNP